MNLLRDEIEDIAERIKLKLIAKGPQCVYAKHTGTVAVYRASDVRNETCSPACMVGSYTRAVKVVEIEDDLRARMREIAA
ncbi:hypothetical protein ACQR5V_21465 [Xanthomonas oryzae pv. oryzicola]|uniref:hypothetical protein n=1 Tax=Xanthomonas oryzae TaxID=347 RepID=UPI0005CDFA4D|nr:hypothetical protein [Xanthomonas oryzae]AJQ88063.1 hypothetical protein BE73_14160 [Xanthomonas oryzae pv. oryzicola]AVU02492.1 hypothetical protein C0L90_08530 [Xanthomonas oryzae pv. oryzae]OWB26849.1 hypothetical protein XocBAI21_17470 [Xanthomonas oryzae pv. oryzicola]QBI15692.1 hypothetical protein EYR03_08600 [Xanthomonas oryzae pv. oryzae]QBI15741.1 hypothetical protein EYR03_08890 [Xanthomonas oryzae pv. oryzae]